MPPPPPVPRAGRNRKRKDPDVVDERTARLQKRMVKNRESAARSRQRKQQYTSELEAQARAPWGSAGGHLAPNTLESAARSHCHCKQQYTAELEAQARARWGVAGGDLAPNTRESAAPLEQYTAELELHARPWEGPCRGVGTCGHEHEPESLQ